MDAMQKASTTTKLAAAGFIRQNYAGIFQFLPLGLRVLEKLERLIDKHMRSLGASKLSLSSISSQALWDCSGRLNHGEMFKFQDRAKGKWLLAPTHEEEITTLMQDFVHAPNQLPARLYQIGRKYRDEQRPRGGLLRGREFIMKDLYTFDKDVKEAEQTYQKVRGAYRNMFDELGVPYVEVRADSGNMGGNLSHEFHFPHADGEDTVITCNNCDYSRNEEFVSPVKTDTRAFRPVVTEETQPEDACGNVISHSFISKDSRTLVKVLTRSASSDKLQSLITRERINTHVLKSILRMNVDLDTGIEESAAKDRFARSIASVKDMFNTMNASDLATYYVADKRVSRREAVSKIMLERSNVTERFHTIPAYLTLSDSASDSRSDARIDLIRHRSNDPCPFCENGRLTVQPAIEIGHTFHLGTRYTSSFGFKVPSENMRKTRSSSQPFVEMGCHGIGVSRLIAAAASCLSIDDYLRWPQTIAPYHVILCTDQNTDGALTAAQALYDNLAETSAGQIDVLLDDRQQLQLGKKMFEARTIGYSVSVVFARALSRGIVEVWHDGKAEDIALDDAAEHVRKLLRFI